MEEAMSDDMRDDEVFDNDTYYKNCSGVYTSRSLMDTPDDEIADKIISVNANSVLKIMVYMGVMLAVLKLLGFHI